MPSRHRDVFLALQELDARTFASHLILDRVPWLWNDGDAYLTWKTELGAGLDVDPHSIIVVGSAATGISLNPRKYARKFGPDSDIDVAVISSYHFELAWKTLRDLSALGPARTASQKKVVEDHRTRLIFDGTIAVDWCLHLLPFKDEWVKALEHSSSQVPGNYEHTVRARLYRDVDALRHYQVKNAGRLKTVQLVNDVVESEPEGAPIATIDE